MMLVRLGDKRRPDSVVGRLLDCHDRIRHFLELAHRIGASEGATEDEVSRTARDVRRYFAEALPLHVQDEEIGILPRLSNRDPDLDTALERMHAEHQSHLAVVAAIVSICETLERSPSRWGVLRADFIASSAEFDRALRAHLEQEEAIIFPAIDRWLGAEEQQAIVSEMAKRRGF